MIFEGWLINRISPWRLVVAIGRCGVQVFGRLLIGREENVFSQKGCGDRLVKDAVAADQRCAAENDNEEVSDFFQINLG
jgi:hypothetical protein